MQNVDVTILCRTEAAQGRFTQCEAGFERHDASQVVDFKGSA